MFNFLFDSSLGNILAPVKSSICQFHLAIQHNRVDEINNFLQSGSVPLGDVNDSGYADIHVACRYNNRYALELLLNRGVSKDLQDKNGNTCVHYASKYGHVDTCRLLIDKGCSPIVKNSSGQTPYDVAENHLIRQYLLPLQFQAERDSGVPVATPQVVPGPDSSPLYEAANSLMVPRPSYPGYMGSHPQFSQPLADSAPLPYAPLPQSFPSSSGAAPPLKSASPSLPGSHLAPSSVEPGPATQTAPLSVPSIPRPPIAGGVVVNKIQATNILPNKSPALNFESDSASPRAGDNSPSAAGVISSAPVQFMSPHRPVAAPAASVPGPPLVAAASSWAPPPAPHQAVGASSIRIIRPDGFGSSASDPNLQKKYGHVKEIQKTAPPPIFGPPVSSSGSGQDSPAASQPMHAQNPYSMDSPAASQPMYAQNPYSMPNPYALPVPVMTHSRSSGSMSGSASAFSSEAAPSAPDVFNPKSDHHVYVEASSTSSSIL